MPDQSSNVSGKNFCSLQFARAIAVICVVVYHSNQAIEIRTNVLTTRMTDFCASGVDIFFVISGLIMVLTVRRQTGFSPIDFLMRRAIRIVPIYWFYTGLKSVTLLVMPRAAIFSHFSLLHLVASLLFVPIANDSRGAVEPVILVGWTLSYEWLFYLFFAICLMIFPRRPMVFVASILVFTSAIHYAVPPSDVYLFFWTNPVVLEFTLGIVAAHLYLSGLQPSRLTTFLLIAVGATLLVVVPQNAEARPLTWGLPAFALVYGLLSAEQYIPFHRVRSLMVIGDSSYSIYLVHTLVIPVLAALALHVRNWPPYELAVPLLLIVCGATLIGCVTYRLIERPLTQVLQKAWRRYQARSNTTQVAPHAIISSGFYVEPQRDLKRPV